VADASTLGGDAAAGAGAGTGATVVGGGAAIVRCSGNNINAHCTLLFIFSI
jgi:hypothetical protein